MRKNSLMDMLSYWRIRLLLLRRPLDINVETYAFCPMKCVFCCNRKYERKHTLMSLRLFEKVVKEYCTLFGGGAIGIGSMQSDFLSDPLLMKRLQILKKYKNKLYIYSTTPLISLAKYSDREVVEILKIFDYLEISVEGFDKDTYKQMAGINGFAVFREQLERVERLISNYGINLFIKIAFRTYNINALKESKLYKKMKLKYKSNLSIKNSFFSWFGSIHKEDLIEGANLIIKDNTHQKENCAVPYATLAVQADGKVVGCGCIDWLEKYVLGDCKKQRLDVIWNSRRARQFRNAFQHGKLPSICKECGLYISMHDAFAQEQLVRYKPMDGVYYNVGR